MVVVACVPHMEERSWWLAGFNLSCYRYDAPESEYIRAGLRGKLQGGGLLPTLYELNVQGRHVRQRHYQEFSVVLHHIMRIVQASHCNSRPAV